MTCLDPLIETPLHRFPIRAMVLPDSLIETPHWFPIRMALVALFRFVQAMASLDLLPPCPLLIRMALVALFRFARAMASLDLPVETPSWFLIRMALFATYRFARAMVSLDFRMEPQPHWLPIRVALFVTYRAAPKLDRLFVARCLAVWVVSPRAVVQPEVAEVLYRAAA